MHSWNDVISIPESSLFYQSLIFLKEIVFVPLNRNWLCQFATVHLLTLKQCKVEIAYRRLLTPYNDVVLILACRSCYLLVDRATSLWIATPLRGSRHLFVDCATSLWIAPLLCGSRSVDTAISSSQIWALFYFIRNSFKFSSCTCSNKKSNLLVLKFDTG